jgi:hypothetical protein
VETLTPGTLCWVQTDDTAPALARNRRCLAVKADVGSQRWLLLIPNSDDADPWSRASEIGWQLQHHLTFDQLRTLNVNRFVDTHRGWWPGTGATFIETAVGHWCTEHKVFHATESCPTEGTFAYTARIAQLELDLAEARRANEVLVREHEEFIDRASEILGEEADDHDLCETYDRVAERAGLRRRTRDHEVTIEVTYRQVLQVHARSAGAAEEDVREAEIESDWMPSTPLYMDVEGANRPTDVTVKVIVEPPF